jgi:filamentous hemagglutinin
MDALQANTQQALQEAGLSSESAKAIAQGIAGVAAAGMGTMVGGAQGAAAAFTVDANNRQLHHQEKTLAKKLAAQSGGKYTAAQIEAQMRGMTMTKDGVTEVGKTDTVIGGNPKPDNGGTWLYAGTSSDGKPIVTQQLDAADAEIRAYIVQNTTGAAVPSLITYAGYYVAQPPSKITGTSSAMPTAACGYGDANCAAGIQPDMTSAEFAQRRDSAAGIASSVSAQAGRFSAAAMTYGTVLASSPDPISKAGAVTQFGLASTATVIGFGAQTVEQLLRPNAGQYVTGGLVDIITTGISGKFPILGSGFTELGEAIKSTPVVNQGTQLLNDALRDKK